MNGLYFIFQKKIGSLGLETLLGSLTHTIYPRDKGAKE